MSFSDSLEVTAATVEQAIRQALEELGAHEDDVSIEVLSTPRTGVLGLGARQARVKVTRRIPEGAHSKVTSPPPAPPPNSIKRATASGTAPEPQRRIERTTVIEREISVEIDEEESLEPSAAAIESPDDERESVDIEAQAEEAAATLKRILELMGEKAEVETVRDATEGLELNIKADGSGLLIGRHGQTLDALEYLVNRMLARRIKDAPPISIDTESYRARRRWQLHRMALSKGEQAKREHVAVMLDPMPPRDRRIVHLALKEDPLVTTRSSGDGFLRSIQIVPTDERRDSGGGRGGHNRRRERDEERDRTSPGQHGGFKHGQKRIV